MKGSEVYHGIGASEEVGGDWVGAPEVALGEIGARQGLTWSGIKDSYFYARACK